MKCEEKMCTSLSHVTNTCITCFYYLRSLTFHCSIKSFFLPLLPRELLFLWLELNNLCDLLPVIFFLILRILSSAPWSRARAHEYLTFLQPPTACIIAIHLIAQWMWACLTRTIIFYQAWAKLKLTFKAVEANFWLPQLTAPRHLKKQLFAMNSLSLSFFLINRCRHHLNLLVFSSENLFLCTVSAQSFRGVEMNEFSINQ